MEDNKNTLNGFEALFQSDFKGMNGNADDDSIYGESLTDEEFAKLTGVKTGADDDHEEEEGNDIPKELQFEDDEKPAKKRGRPRKEVEENEEDDSEEDKIPANVEDKTKQEGSTEESEFDSDIITGLFGAVSEELGWEVEEDQIPTTPEELVKFVSEEIKASSKPTYYSEEIERLDEYVKNGGRLADYLQIEAELDFDNMNVEDESNQKVIVREFLKEKGFSNEQIAKKINKYEQAGILEDEAIDAVDSLKVIKAQKKEQLLEEKRIQAEEYQRQQQKSFQDVVEYIKGLSDIRGVKVPEKDKKVLAEYILKPSKDGQTAFQKAYAQNFAKNLVESAYFALKGDLLINSAKQEGNSAAIAKFKNSLSNKGAVTKKTKGQATSTSDNSIWEMMGARFRKNS